MERELSLLVARAQSGDRVALDRVLQSLQNPLYRHVLAIVRDSDIAMDVLQDSLFTISRKLKTLRDPLWLKAWAYRIATRAAVRRSRSEKRWGDTLRDDDLTDVENPEIEELFQPEQHAALPSLIDALPPASQIVLRMHYFEELTHVEIAEALEVPLGTVKSRLGYGLGVLRRELAKAGAASVSAATRNPLQHNSLL